MAEKQDENAKEFTKQQTDLLAPLIRNLSMALKNSVLYSVDHPIFASSVNNFKSALEMWLASEERCDIGISQDELFVGGISVGAGNERAMEVASYLHMRGMISVSFLKGVEIEELKSLFGFLKEDKKIIREKGGILKNVPATPHVQVKEIDYSALLAKEQAEAAASDEGKIWKFLFDIGNDIKAGGDLPGSKIEFLVDFFKSSDKSAAVINKVYKEAMSKMEGQETAENIRGTVAKICNYFEKQSPQKSKEIKVELMRIVSQLHPDLINVLFEKTVVDDRSFDLADEVTKDFSDSFIASFIESLITQEDMVNENLIKIFDKLAPGETRANSVVSMVADRLLGKRVLNADALSKLQTSVKDIFKAHPHSGFMTQMYNITVDAVLNKKIDTLIYMARLSPLLNKFAQSMAEEKLKKEEIWLLMNILWLESNPLEFNKFSSKLVGTLSELLDAKDTVRVREILQFFTERMRPEQMADGQMSVEIKDTISRLTSKEAIDSIISLIPEANPKGMEDIADILSRTGNRAASPLVDAYLAAKNPAQRNKFRMIFARNKEAVVNEAITRLEYAEIGTAKDLLDILKEHDTDKANLIAKRLLWHKDPRIRWAGLETIVPSGEEDRNAIFLMFRKERDKEVQKKAAMVLLETKEQEIIKRLFENIEKSFFRRSFLPQLVDACGRIRCQEALPHLKQIFIKKAFFNTAARDNLRVAVVTALGRIRTAEAMELVRTGVDDRSEKVRKLCDILVKLDQSGSANKPKDEV